MKILISMVALLLSLSNFNNTNIASDVIQPIFDEAKTSDVAFENLRYLTEKFPKRLACYSQNIKAAKWTKEIMQKMNLDNVFLQEAQVMNWKLGNVKTGQIRSNNGLINVNVCSFDTESSKIEKIQTWAKLFEPYGIDVFVKGYSGVDIGNLKTLGHHYVGY